jgi:hypothetical protein
MTDPIRVYCYDPDYRDTWFEFDGRWTLAEQRRMVAVEGDDFWTFLRSKTVACHIQDADGTAITDPAQIGEEGLAGCDVLVVAWLDSALPLAIAKRRTLVNASARLSSPSNGQNRTETTKTTMAALSLTT